MNPVLYWVMYLTHWFRLIPVCFVHWLGDTFMWYRSSKGGIWCRWNGFWAKADGNNYARYQRGMMGYDPAEGKWRWDYDQMLKVGDAPIDRTENYDAEDASIRAREAKEKQ